jgi:Lar family restriction alleviation protein
MNKLKPCPFCGNEGIIKDSYGYHFVYCNNCGAHIQNTESMESSVNFWNGRALEDYYKRALEAAEKMIEYGRCIPGWAEEYYKARDEYKYIKSLGLPPVPRVQSDRSPSEMTENASNCEVEK